MDESRGNSSGDNGVQTDGASALWGKEYTGTAEVSVDVYDYCGDGAARRPAGTRTYSMPATLRMNEPGEGGGQTENNPFSLALDIGQPAEAGALSFASSSTATTSGEDAAGNPRDPEVLLTYWDLSWDGSALKGELTDPHTAEAVALNLLNWADPLVPCRPGMGTLPGGQPHPVESGATLEGGLTSDKAGLEGRGATRTGLQEFEFTFTGTP